MASLKGAVRRVESRAAEKTRPATAQVPSRAWSRRGWRCLATRPLDLFRLHTIVRPTVIDKIIDRLIGRGPAACNWVGALDELVVAQPLAVLEHTQRIKQLLEYVLALPPATATSMLSSLLPLQKQRPELRDHLVLLLRKAMFSREEGTRLTAVHGFLQLLHTTGGKPAAADGGGGGAGAGTSMMEVDTSNNEDVHFQLELLGFIRRSLTQQAAIRAALYEGIVPAFIAQPHLRPMVFELLLAQLGQYTDVYDDDATASQVSTTSPILIDRCLQYAEDGSSPPSLVEPLPQLIRAITRCVVAARGVGGGADDNAEGEDGGGAGGSGNDIITSVVNRMRMMVDRVALCSLKHFRLHGDVVLTAKDKNGPHNYAISTFLNNTLEALLDHALLCHVKGNKEGAANEQQAVCMATQAVGTQAATGGFSIEDPAVEASRRIFTLGRAVSELMSVAKIKPAEKNMPAWLQFDLSLPACSRVLAALQADAAAASAAAGGGGKSTLARSRRRRAKAPRDASHGTSSRRSPHAPPSSRPPRPPPPTRAAQGHHDLQHVGGRW